MNGDKRPPRGTRDGQNKTALGTPDVGAASTADEFPRLGDSGTEDERLLLSGAAPVPSAAFAHEVRLAVEARIFGPPRGQPRSSTWQRFAMASLGVLFASSALAYGVVRWRLGAPSPVPRDPLPVTAPRGVNVQPLETPTADDEAQPEAPATASDRRRPGIRPRVRPPETPREVALATPPPEPPPADPAIAQPGLTLDRFFGSSGEPPSAPSESAPEPRPTETHHVLGINWGKRRQVSLTIGSGGNKQPIRIQGRVNRVQVDLESRGGVMTGKIDDQPVNIWTHGHAAEGSIAGYPVDLAVVAIADGYLVRGTLPGHTARVELRRGFLRWYPGCEYPLAAVAPGVYQGSCADGEHATVSLPAAIQRLAPVPKMLLLALLLTARDPVFQYHDPNIFDAP